MNLKNRLVAMVLVLACVSAWAAEVDGLMVKSTQKAQGATAMGPKSFYTKDFEIGLANLSQKPMKLDTVCLEALSADGKKFNLDTVDEKLTKGTLGPNKVVRGMASFTSGDTSVYSAMLVKASVCK
jgi:Domain of unknown function (DUF4354)